MKTRIIAPITDHFLGVVPIFDNATGVATAKVVTIRATSWTQAHDWLGTQVAALKLGAGYFSDDETLSEDGVEIGDYWVTTVSNLMNTDNVVSI